MSKVLSVIANLLIILGAIVCLGLLSIGLDYIESEAKSGAPLIEAPLPSDSGGEATTLPF